jgi:hypothetical protein
MNLRCAFCQTPYTLSRVEKISALQHMDAEKLTHYDAHCPRCRRATPIPRQRLEATMPNWRESLKDLEVEMAAHPQQAAPLPKPETAAPAQAEPMPEPALRAETTAKTLSPKGQTATVKKPAKKSK